MSKSQFITPILLLASLGILASALPVEAIWKTKDQENIGKAIGAYYQAKDEKKGIHEAEADLHKALERLGRKHKDIDLLTFVEDWEASLREAQMMTVSKAKPKKGKVYEDRSEDYFGNTLAMYLHFPKKFSVKNGPLPLVIIIPDEGQDPKTLIDEQWVDADGRDSAILAAVRMPSDTNSWGQFSASEESGIGTVMSAFAYIKKEFPVDMDRIFLVGSGKGISAALGTAAAFPHQFAGVVGRGGMPASDATNFRNVPTLFLAGGSHATEFQEQAKELGFENCDLNAAGGEADVWSWIGSRVRDPYPSSVLFSPTSPYTLSCGWVKVEGFDEAEDPKVTATVNREENTITVNAEKIATVVLFFNDVLVDMDQPVRVIINGVTHEQTLERTRRTLLDLGYNQGDWGRVFTATQAFDVE